MDISDIVWPAESDWHLGVTGTRWRNEDGVTYPTPASIAMLRHLLIDAVQHGAKYLHHGACTGWDEQAVDSVTRLGLDYLVYAHPPAKDTHLSQYALDHSHVVHKPKAYPDRNHDLATASAVLLTGGQYPEFDPRAAHSGTRMTTRMGRRLGVALYAVDMKGELSDVTRQVIAGTNATEAGV